MKLSSPRGEICAAKQLGPALGVEKTRKQRPRSEPLTLSVRGRASNDLVSRGWRRLTLQKCCEDGGLIPTSFSLGLVVGAASSHTPTEILKTKSSLLSVSQRPLVTPGGYYSIWLRSQSSHTQGACVWAWITL